MRKNQLVTDHFHCITILAGQPAQKTHVGFSILGHPVDSDGLNAAHQFQSVLSGNPPRNSCQRGVLKTTTGFSPQGTVNRGGHPTDKNNGRGRTHFDLVYRERTAGQQLLALIAHFQRQRVTLARIPFIQPAAIGVVQLHLNGIGLIFDVIAPGHTGDIRRDIRGDVFLQIPQSEHRCQHIADAG